MKQNFSQTSLGVIILGIVTAMIVYFIQTFIHFGSNPPSVGQNIRQETKGNNSPAILNTGNGNVDLQLR